MFCKQCGAECADTAVICLKCGSATGFGSALVPNDLSAKGRVAYIILGLFLGGLGIHNFYAGRTGTAVIQLVLWFISLLLTFVAVGLFGFIVLWIWALIEVCVVTTDGAGKRFS